MPKFLPDIVNSPRLDRLEREVAEARAYAKLGWMLNVAAWICVIVYWTG